MPFAFFEHIIRLHETKVQRPISRSEHDSLFVNYIRVKLGLEVDMQRSLQTYRSGGSKRKYDHELIKELRNNGLLIREICAQIGCPELTVLRVLNGGKK